MHAPFPQFPSALRRFSHAVAGALLFAGMAGIGVAQDRSPFIPDGFGAAPPPPAAPSAIDRYQFVGVVTIVDQTFVTLVDTSTSKTIMCALGETVNGVRVTGFEPGDGTVQLEINGQSKRMKLTEPKIVAMASPPPTPMAPQNGPLAQNPPQNVPPAVAGAPISDEEARMRMQRVAEEIRRRREMRRQMLENQQQPPRPQ